MTPPDEDHRFDESYWDGVWAGDSGVAMGSAPPNPHLVRETAALGPGRALEVGCGAGAEAIWLAGRGWQVTGADLAQAALDRARERAEEAGVSDLVEWVLAGLSTWAPAGQYDLVTTHYAHPAMPQLDFYDRLATWVAPGGTLFVVGHLSHGATGDDSHHDHSHRRHGADDHGSTPPDVASVTAASITARLDPESWRVVAAEEPRRVVTGPDGRERTLDDVVVRAVRRR